MKITILTLFPRMIEGFLNESIVRRAQEKGLVEIEIVNIRDFAVDSYGTVDDHPYGGGAGMIMRVDLIKKALESLKLKIENQKVILTSAKGKAFNQQKAQEFTHLDHLVLLCGHYEGVDERALGYIDEELSIGDYVMTGGELAAAVVTDAVTRLLPGVLKKQNATEEESFFSASIIRIIEVVGEHPLLIALQKKGVKEVQLLEYPQYTRPELFEDKKVPEILLSGDPKKIKAWQLKKAFEETLQKRPDFLA